VRLDATRILVTVPDDDGLQEEHGLGRAQRGRTRGCGAAMVAGMALIQVPYMAGDGHHPASEGPSRLVRALSGQGVEVERVDAPPGPFPGGAVDASAAVNAELAAVVRRTVAADRFPLVLAGSCDAAIGVTAALSRRPCGVVWVDAHADFNTPASSVSGFLPGMSLAVVTGHCHRDVWREVGGRAPVAESDVVLVGVRSESPAEESRRLERSAIQVVRWRAGEPSRDVERCLDRLASRVDRIYLHIDNDAFDPRVAPGVVDDPVPGGMTLSHVLHVVEATAARFHLAAATIATYTPRNDQHDRTLKADLTVIELLARRVVG